MPPDDPITTYIECILIPQYQSFGVQDRKTSIVAEDIQRRLQFLLARWHNLPFCRTILTLGLEEASFYEPRSASLDVRSLVVIGVRNSLLEDLASTKPAMPALRQNHRMLTDREIAITTAAIEHFQKALDAAPGGIQSGPAANEAKSTSPAEIVRPGQQVDVCVSGIATRLDPALIQILRPIKEGDVPCFSPIPLRASHVIPKRSFA